MVIDTDQKLRKDLAMYFFPVWFKFFVSFIVVDYLDVYSHFINMTIACAYSLATLIPVSLYFFQKIISEKKLLFFVILADALFQMLIYRPDKYPKLFGLMTIVLFMYYIYNDLIVKSTAVFALVTTMFIGHIFIDAVVNVHVYFILVKILIIGFVFVGLHYGKKKGTEKSYATST